MKGTSIPRAGKALNSAGFLKTKDNGVNETWHIHKRDPSKQQLNDEGKVSADPNKTHIGIRNPANLPAVRGRPHGS